MAWELDEEKMRRRVNRGREKEREGERKKGEIGNGQIEVVQGWRWTFITTDSTMRVSFVLLTAKVGEHFAQSQSIYRRIHVTYIQNSMCLGQN